MSYDLKVILKKSKPVIWYGLKVPGGITFSALSVFLDIISGTDDAISSNYIFDLPSFGVQLREEIFDDDSYPLHKQALREADTTFIDEYMKTDSWFTYKPDTNQDTAFRIEVKEVSNKIQIFPSPGRYSRGVWEFFEKNDTNAFIDRMKELMCYRVQYDEGFHFMKKMELLDERRKKKNLSAGAMSLELDAYVAVPAMTTPVSRSQNTIRSLVEETTERMEQILEVMSIRNFFTADMRSLREMLYSIYKEEDLRQLADMIGANADLPKEILTLAKTNDRERVSTLMLAKRCADRMLQKECMEERLLTVNDRQMETFKRAVNEGGVFKATSFAESDDMAFFCELDYAASTNTEDVFLVPTDVMEAFKRIDTPEFHYKRQQHVWLMDCLDVVEYYYGSIPIRQFYRLYRQFGKLSREEMVEAIQALSDLECFCTVYDGRIIYYGWLHDDEYKALENYQGDKDYYIPTKKEVEDISWNGYPSQQREIKTLYAFLENEMEMNEINAQDMTEEIWHILNQGDDFHDVMDLVNKKKLVFPSEKAMKKFMEYITRLNNTTPMLYNRGFRPNDLITREKERIRRNGLTIVPGSTQAAGMLAEAADQLRAMGVNIDLNSNADRINTALISPDRKTVITGKKKIYPNDRCPCGSGKKYKNCCGRAR